MQVEEGYSIEPDYGHCLELWAVGFEDWEGHGECFGCLENRDFHFVPPTDARLSKARQRTAFVLGYNSEKGYIKL